MSIKHFCDTCGVELSDANTMRLNGDGTCEYLMRQSEAAESQGTKPRIQLRVIGEVCKYCVISTLDNAIDDRARHA